MNIDTENSEVSPSISEDKSSVANTSEKSIQSPPSPEISLKDWIINTPSIQYRKNNIRAWGSYELTVSCNSGVSWVHFTRPFGYGWSEPDALEFILNDYLKHNSTETLQHQQIKNWLGDFYEKVCEIIGLKSS